MTFDDAVPKKLIVLFVPSADEHGYWNLDALNWLTYLYGGATSYNATGSWDDNGKLIVEDVKAVHCYASLEDFNNKNKQKSLIAFCKDMGSFLKQSEVGLVVDGKYLGIRDFE